MAPSPKTFKCDDSVLDPAVKAHIASLYLAVDSGDHKGWAAHFTENAELKKGTTNVRGRDTLEGLISQSWSTLESRDHVVYAVFPFSPKTEEVMLHGQSYNLYKTGEKTTFTWAARMHFTKNADGSVLIDKYTIIVDPDPATLS